MPYTTFNEPEPRSSNELASLRIIGQGQLLDSVVGSMIGQAAARIDAQEQSLLVLVRELVSEGIRRVGSQAEILQHVAGAIARQAVVGIGVSKFELGQIVGDVQLAQTHAWPGGRCPGDGWYCTIDLKTGELCTHELHCGDGRPVDRLIVSGPYASEDDAAIDCEARASRGVQLPVVREDGRPPVVVQLPTDHRTTAIPSGRFRPDEPERSPGEADIPQASRPEVPSAALPQACPVEKPLPFQVDFATYEGLAATLSLPAADPRKIAAREFYKGALEKLFAVRTMNELLDLVASQKFTRT